MKMRLLVILIGMMAILTVCQSGQNQATNPATTTTDNSGKHKVVVTEVINTTKYTYLHVKEKNTESWLAVPLMQAKVGETYYYEGGFVMNKFESKELKRTFDAVIFLEKVTPEGGSSAEPAMENPHAGGNGAMTKSEKVDVKIKPVAGGVTIADLYKK